jgi:hypothetical protein
VWVRREKDGSAEGRLSVALRVELFAQLKVGNGLDRLTPTKFMRLATAYGIAEDRPNTKVNGQRAAILQADFIAGLLAVPEEKET